MKFTVQQIADILEGEIEGNPTAEVWTLSKIEEGKQGSISFLSNEKYTPYIYSTNATATIVSKRFVAEKKINTTLIRVENAYEAFSKLLEFYNQSKSNKTGIEKNSYVSNTATLGKNVYVGTFAYIGDNVSLGDNVKIYPNTTIGDNVTIGSNTTIFSGVHIYSETQIGNNCTVHSGCIIGSDGFGFSNNKEGIYSKVPQIGNVIIEDYVDIGAATTIDRATLGSTIIRKGVKLDNQIQIAHNVEIGKNTVIAAQTGVAGSTKVGENCMIGGQVGMVGHINIGNNVKVQAQTGIARNVKNNEVLQGTPALGYVEFNKSYVHFKNLSNLVSKVDDLENKIKIFTGEDK